VVCPSATPLGSEFRKTTSHVRRNCAPGPLSLRGFYTRGLLDDYTRKPVNQSRQLNPRMSANPTYFMVMPSAEAKESSSLIILKQPDYVMCSSFRPGVLSLKEPNGHGLIDVSRAVDAFAGVFDLLANKLAGLRRGRFAFFRILSATTGYV
jgi:hypothetical protein